MTKTLNLDLAPTPLAADDIPAFVALARTEGANLLAKRAANALRALFQQIDGGHLLRRAALQSDPAAWLRQLGQDAERSRSELTSEAAQAARTLRTDAGERHAFDSLAMELLGLARSNAELQLRLARSYDETAQELKIKLASAGLSADEIAAAIAVRQSEPGRRDERRDAAMAAHEAAAAEAAALEAFLSDPLRQTIGLPEELAARLFEGTANRAANAATLSATSMYWPRLPPGVAAAEPMSAA